MKKRISAIFLMSLALMTSQGTVSANTGEAFRFDSQIVTAGEELAETKLFDDPYMNLPGYYEEGDHAWEFQDGCLQAYAHEGENIVSYRVTPNIMLAKDNTIEIVHKGMWFADMSKEVSMCIRVAGGEWVPIEGMHYGADCEEVSSGAMSIPSEFDGKEVQIGFRYTAKNAALAGCWQIKSMVVKGMAAKKQDAGLSFSEESLSYELGSPKAFVEPTLNNPNNLNVHYETDDWQIVNLDWFTGKVSFNGDEGTATIRAKSDATPEFEEGLATYTITVKDPLLVYRAKLQDDNCGFTEEGSNGAWSFYWGCAVADGTQVSGETNTYYVSPEFTLSADGNIVSFDQKSEYITEENMPKQLSLAIREVGGEWTDLQLTNYPDPSVYWDYKNSGEIAIPAEFNGKTVQIAFKFFANGNDLTGKWSVKNLIVSKSVERAEAGISYDQAEYTYEIGSADPFTAPVLNNPNDIKVRYFCNDGNGIVEVNEETGEVKILDAGTVTINAETKRNNVYEAGSASYKLTIIDNTLVFKAPFAGNASGFVEEGDYGVWSSDGYYNTSLWVDEGKVPAGTKIYFVSPKMTLGKSNTVQWMQNGYMMDWDNQVKFAIREVGGEWEEFDVSYTDNNMMENVDLINIPENYDEKEVEMALIYIADGTLDGWNLKNFVVRKALEKKEKADPEISFAETEVTYVVGSGDFVAPELNNPNNVEVVYSSSNKDIAEVVEGGWVYIYDLGTVTITATSVENDQFKSATASYTLTITDVPTGIEGITADDLNSGKIYDLQGRRVSKLGKGVFIINGKKVVIK